MSGNPSRTETLEQAAPRPRGRPAEFFRTIGIVLNDRCPLRCKHCSIGFSDDFRGSTAVLDEAELRTLIRELDTSLYEVVTMVGGEPSMVPKLLRAGIEASREVGLQSGITTAPIWAATREKADRFVGKLPRFDFLTLSFDQHHLEFLEIDHYRHAAEAAAAKGITVTMNLCYSHWRERTQLVGRITHFLHLIEAIHTSRILPLGNAAAWDEMRFDRVTLESTGDLDRLERSCRVGNPLVDVDRRVWACCWASGVEDSPLGYTPWEGGRSVRDSLGAMERDPCFKAMRRGGLIDSLGEHGRKAVLEALRNQSFVNECHLCLTLMEKENRRIWNEGIELHQLCE